MQVVIIIIIIIFFFLSLISFDSNLGNLNGPGGRVEYNIFISQFI